MTEEQKINQTYAEIVNSLRSRRLKAVIEQLSPILSTCSDWNLQTSFEEVKTSYDYMLQYMLQGTNDPERKKLYNNIVIRLMEITERAYNQLLDNQSSTFFHLLRNKANKYAVTQDLLQTAKHLESVSLDISVNNLMPDKDTQSATAQYLYQYEKNLFLQTWTNISWSNDDVEAAKYISNSSSISPTDYCLFISAVTLSLLQCFDLPKLTWLFNVYMQKPSPRIRQRSIIGIFLVLHTYSARIKYYPTIEERLSLLKDEPCFSRDLTQCYINFIYCRETEKITQIMNNEIVPDILKDMNSNPDLHKTSNNDDEEEISPVLFPQIHDKDLQSKLEKLTKLSMEGGDLYMSTFQHLKGFAFFHDLENWFKPFDTNQPIVIKSMDTKDSGQSVILDFIRKAIYLCDNDKYSLVHMIPQLPINQFKMMKEQLEQAEEQMQEEEEKNGILDEDDKAYKLENGNYMHDLYRFFKLNPRKKEFNDVFSDDLFLSDNKEIIELLYRSKNLILLAEFLLKKKYWKEAGYLYRTMIQMEENNANLGDLYSRLGYTYQKQQLFSEAIDCYMKVGIFTEDNPWLKEQMATCHRQNMNYQEALSYYRDLEQLQPENISILYHIGICLGELQQYNEALRYFLKIDFIQPDDLRNWRAIAWYSFVCDKMEQGDNYYQKIIEKSATAKDFLNYGHLKWVEGNTQAAVKNYRQALALFGNTKTFIIAFQIDIPLLTQKGIDADIIPLMIDMVS